MVKYIYTYGDYKGESPTYRGTNANDRAIDLCCGSVWAWTGSEWVLADTTGSCTLSLGTGKSLAEILRSADTVIPSNIKVYIGTDSHVPHKIRCTKNDLVINHNIGSTIRHAVLSYFDSVADCWIGPDQAETFITTRDRCWSVWRNFADKVIPFRSSVTLISTNAIAGGSGNTGSSDLDPIIVNKLEKLANKLEITDDGKLFLVNDSGNEQVKTLKIRHIELSDLTVNNLLLLENPPSYIITSDNQVIYMSSEYDKNKNCYVVDFTGVSLDGVWKIIY